MYSVWKQKDRRIEWIIIIGEQWQQGWYKRIKSRGRSYLDVWEEYFEHVGGRVAGVEEHQLGLLQVVGRQALLDLNNVLRSQQAFLRNTAGFSFLSIFTLNANFMQQSSYSFHDTCEGIGFSRKNMRCGVRRLYLSRDQIHSFLPYFYFLHARLT